jgi:hypothetical protein
MTVSANARVKKHRAKLRAELCGRLEVWLGLGLIDQVRQLAKRRQMSTWEVVEEALTAHVTGHAGT